MPAHVYDHEAGYRLFYEAEGSYNYTYTNTTLKDSEVYVVAVVDYVYYGKPYLFTNEISHIATDILMRDLLIDYIRENYSK